MAVQLSNKIRLFFILSQLFYMAFGASMFGVGIYSIVNLQRFGQFTQNTYVAGAAIFVGVGVLKFVFGLLGILALYWQKKPLTITFTLGVILLMMLTFVAGIYGFISRPGAYFTTRDRLESALANYDENRDEIDTIEDTFDCCGIMESEDYIKMDPSKAAVDCNIIDTRKLDEDIVLPKGCLVYLTREIQQDLYVVGAIGLGFATTELVGLLIAMQNFEGL